MNLKEKLEGYRKREIILFISISGTAGRGAIGRIEEVGDDYIVCRRVIGGMKIKDEFLNTLFGLDEEYEYKIYGTTIETIPFANLIIQSFTEDKGRYRIAVDQFMKALEEDEKK